MPTRRFTDQQEREICRRYLGGETHSQLSASFDAAFSTVYQVLKRNGIAKRKCRFAANVEPDVCRRYLAGEDTTLLAQAFGVGSTTICSILARNGVERRTTSLAKGGLPSCTDPEVCRRYLQGENTVLLAAAFGVCNATISKILKRNGVETRRYTGFGDSVQDALDGTGRHEQPRDCELYLFELARYANTHCKPGIAFDVDHRCVASGGEYGGEVLRLLFSTRQEAYFLEQAILEATRDRAGCPSDLQDWVGASEVRAMPAKDMAAIALRLAGELEDLGVWDFAAQYVPMTAAQRVACQQRAMAC